MVAANCNIDKIELKCTEPAGVRGMEEDGLPSDNVCYNAYGIPVGPDYMGIVIENGKKKWRR